MATIDERNVILKFQADTSDLDKGVKKVESTTKGLGASFKQAGATFAGMFALQGLNAVTQGLSGLGQKTLALAVSAEQTQIAFETFLGSASKAQKIIKELNEFSALTPFQADEVLAAGKSLVAFGVDVEDIIPTLNRIGDIASGTGNNFNELVTIFGKFKTAGRITGEDLAQLAERGINVIPELAKILDIQEAQVREAVSQGKVSFKEIEQSFINLTSEGGKFFELTAKNSQSLGGRISSLKDEFDRVLKALGEALLPTLKQAVEVFISLAKAITPEAFINFANAILTLTAAYAAYNFSIIASTTATVANRIAVIASNVAMAAQAVAMGIYALATGGATAATQAYRLSIINSTIATRIFNAVVKANPIGLLVSALTLAVGALYSFSGNTNNAAEAQERLNKALAAGKERESAIEELKEFAKKRGEITQAEKDRNLRLLEEEFNATIALQDDLRKKKQEIADEDLKQIQKSLKSTTAGNIPIAIEVDKELSERNVLGLSAIEIEANIETLKRLRGEIESKKIIKEAASKEDIKAAKAKAKEEQELREKEAQDIIDAENKLIEDLNELNKKQNEQALKNAEDLSAAQIEASKKRIEREKQTAAELADIAEFVKNAKAKSFQEGADAEVRAADALRILLLSADGLTLEQREQIENDYSDRLKEIEIERLQFKLSTLKEGSNEYLNLEQEIANAEFDLIKKQNEKIANEQLKRAEERIELAETVAKSIISVSKDVLDAEVNDIERKIDFQQKAVDKALKIQEDGGSSQVALEQKRLEQLNAQRERAVERQKVLAAIEIAVNTAIAVSEGIRSITKAFASPGGAVTGVATAVALAATVASAIIALRQATADIPAFAEGTEYFDGKGTGTSDSNLVRISRGERVVTAKMNDKYFDTLNEFHNGTAKADYLHALAMGEIAPSMVSQEHFVGGSSYDSKKLERLIEGTNKRLDRMDINVNLDKDGFAASISQWQNKKQRVNSKLR